MHFALPLPRIQVENIPPMSTDPTMPLFEISNHDDLSYKDDPVVTQVKANLTAAERVQQERAEQRRLEREERKAQAEAERLAQEIKEVERKRRELDEVELEQLTLEKERLEEETCVEQQCAEVLRGLERAAEQRQAVLAASPPEAGPSQAPPQKPERTGGWGLLSLRKTAHGASHVNHYVGGT